MLFPTGDNLTAQKSSVGVLLLVSLMLVIDLPMFFMQSFDVWATQNLGFVPMLFSEAPWGQAHALIASVFLHVDIFHLLGNCLFLWVFGRSLERLFGVYIFLLIFPALGIVGLLAHWALFPDSLSPVVGASGAIATLMGAYLVLFPQTKMRMLFFFGVFFKRFQVPAWVFLFYWIGLQLLSLGIDSGAGSDVAYAVHIGGFAAGVLAAMAWKVSHPFAEEHLSIFVQTALQKN